jgi:hypothetical protein
VKKTYGKNIKTLFGNKIIKNKAIKINQQKRMRIFIMKQK